MKKARQWLLNGVSDEARLLITDEAIKKNKIQGSIVDEIIKEHFRQKQIDIVENYNNVHHEPAKRLSLIKRILGK